MNIFKTIKKTVLNACFYFTVAEFLVLIIATGFSEMSPSSGGTAGMFLSLGSTALIFLACLMISALNLVWKLEYSTGVKVIIHFFGALAAYFLVFVVIPGALVDVAQVIVRIAVFAVLYLIVALIVLLISGIRRTRRTEDLEYEAQFGEFFNDK